MENINFRQEEVNSSHISFLKYEQKMYYLSDTIPYLEDLIYIYIYIWYFIDDSDLDKNVEEK